MSVLSQRTVRSTFIPQKGSERYISKADITFRSFSQLGLTSFPPANKLVQYQSLNFDENPISSFETLPELENLKYLSLDKTNLKDFRGAKTYPSLIEISLRSSPLGKYSMIASMCIIVFGDQIRKVNGIIVTRNEKLRAIQLRPVVINYLMKGWVLTSTDVIRLYHPDTRHRRTLQLALPMPCDPEFHSILGTVESHKRRPPSRQIENIPFQSNTEKGVSFKLPSTRCIRKSRIPKPSGIRIGQNSSSQSSRLSLLPRISSSSSVDGRSQTEINQLDDDLNEIEEAPVQIEQEKIEPQKDVNEENIKAEEEKVEEIDQTPEEEKPEAQEKHLQVQFEKTASKEIIQDEALESSCAMGDTFSCGDTSPMRSDASFIRRRRRRSSRNSKLFKRGLDLPFELASTTSDDLLSVHESDVFDSHAYDPLEGRDFNRRKRSSILASEISEFISDTESNAFDSLVSFDSEELKSRPRSIVIDDYDYNDIEDDDDASFTDEIPSL